MSDDTKSQAETGNAEEIAAQAKAAGAKGPPPVHLWNPPLTGEIDIRIARDGQWYHEGSPIQRPELVRLFASILKTEDGAYFLVTPVEKYRICVEDVPFVAIDFVKEAGVLRFETNVGDTVIASAENPIRVEEDAETGEPAPYIHVRRGLEALIDRKSFYRLAEIGETEGDHTVVRSGEAVFAIGPAI